MTSQVVLKILHSLFFYLNTFFPRNFIDVSETPLRGHWLRTQEENQLLPFLCLFQLLIRLYTSLWLQ